MGQALSWYSGCSEIPRQALIKFTTLGLVVLDEIHFSSTEAKRDVVGGSGAYSTLGARLFQPSDQFSSIGWTIRIGTDFPDSVKSVLQSWGTTLNPIVEANQWSTRGRLEYLDETHDAKTFQYLTPTLDIEPKHLQGTPSLASTSFHILADPLQALDLISKVLRLRKQAGIDDRPLIIWEPRPSSCVPANMGHFHDVMPLVDVFSPNHVELDSFFEKSSEVSPTSIEANASRLLRTGFPDMWEGHLVVRAAELGSLVVSQPGKSFWTPAFYDSGPKIVDPTGAGNAYLGGFTMGLLETSDVVRAAHYGTVAASFALEQIGLPVRSIRDGEELWNGVNPWKRLQEFEGQLG